MNREVIEILRQLYIRQADENRTDAARLRAGTEEFHRAGEDLKAGEIAFQERKAAEYDSLLRELPD